MTERMVRAAVLLERIGRLSRGEEQQGDLNPAQWGILRFLSKANRFSRNPMAVTKYFGATRGTISQSIIALEKKGYVIRTQGALDKRSISVDLTESGREKLEDDPLRGFAAELEASLGDQGTVFVDLLESALVGLLKRNGGQAFGHCKSCRHFDVEGGASEAAPHRCRLLELDLQAGEEEQICQEQVAA